MDRLDLLQNECQPELTIVNAVQRITSDKSKHPSDDFSCEYNNDCRRGDAKHTGVLQLPSDIWQKILEKLRLADVAAPLALTCQLFLHHAKQRLADGKGAVRSLVLLQHFKLAANYVHPRVTDKLLFVVNCNSGGHNIEAWDLRKGDIQASLKLPPPLCHSDVEDVVVARHLGHIAIVAFRTILLLQYQPGQRTFRSRGLHHLGNENAWLDDAALDRERDDADALLARFSSDSEQLNIAHIYHNVESSQYLRCDAYCAVLDQLPISESSIENNLSQVRKRQIELPFGQAMYENKEISLHGIQMNASPFQLLIPPHRIADIGLVVDCSLEGGRVLDKIAGFHEYQVLGFTPDGQYLLETREKRDGASKAVEVLLTETWSLTSGQRRQGAKTMRRRFVVPDGEIVSVQFSSDSGVLLILYGREGMDGCARAGVRGVAGWRLLRVADGGLLSRCESMVEGVPAYMRASCRMSTDGRVLYGYTDGGEWSAWDLYSGIRVWNAPNRLPPVTTHDGASPSDNGDDRSCPDEHDGDGVLVSPVEDGFVGIHIRVDEGGFEFDVYGLMPSEN
jgi:hypothetical protein